MQLMSSVLRMMTNLPEWVKWLLETGACIVICTSVCAFLDRKRHKKDAERRTCKPES